MRVIKMEEDKVKKNQSRYQRYESIQRGKKTTNKKNKCDMCGALVSLRNSNYKDGDHIVLCNACRNRKEGKKGMIEEY
tara:strand:- start:1542 stop:1775 length:234 start_codon:yes stop_codon:yes gene_type:complete